MESNDLNFTTQSPNLSSFEVITGMEALFPYKIKKLLEFNGVNSQSGHHLTKMAEPVAVLL